MENNLLNYIDISIQCGEFVELEFLEKTPEGQLVKVFVNGDDMGDVHLTDNEVYYYINGLFLND